jgi:Tfp pilus assembly protein PilF
MNRFTKIIFISLMATVWIFTSSFSSDPREKKAKHLEKGETYLAGSKYKEAIIEFKNAVQLDPKDAQAHYKLGLAYLKLGSMPNIQEAFRELTKSVELDPDIVDAQLKLGLLYLLSRDYNKAI